MLIMYSSIGERQSTQKRRQKMAKLDDNTADARNIEEYLEIMGFEE